MRSFLPMLFALFLAISASPPAKAQDIREERVRFAAGETGATLKGRIKGYAITDYLLGAQAGQPISIDMTTSNLSSYFNLLPAESGTAIHTGSIAGNQYEGVLPEDGDYRIRVYLMRNAARRNEVADYSLSVKIGARNPDYADGLSGGPDFWDVANVPQGDTLNVRSGAGTGHSVVGELANGDTVRNLGCQMADGVKWCRIEAGGERKFTGWVNGRYLREAAVYPGSNTATGLIPCSLSVGRPTRNCGFRVSRGQNGNASVWVDIGGGKERYIEFRGGKPVTREAGLEVTYEREGDLTLIRMGGVERYEIPDALVHGG